MSEREITPRMSWMAATSLSLLKPWLRRTLMPVAGTLARQRVTANQITVLSIAVSVALGACLAIDPERPVLHALVPLWLVGRTILASLDGTLAVCFGQKSRIGGFLNEAGDIASDVALYAPLALVSPFTVSQIALVLSLAVAGEFVGVCSDWLGAGRRCEGPFGKADRAIAFGATNTWIAVYGPLTRATSVLMSIFVALAFLTLVNRLRFAVYQCRGDVAARDQRPSR
ncbi:CDP-alcohol phosphatidyltransferase family protein [Burkholderia pseudomallei TSV 25]|uniref:CDP-alcohol phosphatidyltransferase family protein n=1 Tax=Burkholderia pseudomallei TaxID=28450 RepID=UPI0005104364|nr:CDP-alcohol phosphatidyltransferase family protein [Burkholderia pseudomallei]AIV47036.1 CDP-alcohol phosphatidyltransferase family protein [Burkholderia pseudomallei TSV 48]KGC35500.1 CDP-alcohol phosphatidyltransferase family protein [Burkholderia pseudomallei]KGW10543.1 CDP-alcohol phosphatidyltransferase family protein [Burkholderia pseudomallei TSV 25]